MRMRICVYGALVALTVGSTLACDAVLDASSYKVGAADGTDAGGDTGGGGLDGTAEASTDGPASRECAVNADCVAKGEYQVCRKDDGRCVSLQSPECTRIVGDYKNDNAIIIGSLNPTTGVDRSSGLPVQNAIEVAIDEFRSVGNVAPRPGSGDRRPLVLVGCDDGSDEEQAVRAAQHLATTLKVPAIIGAAFSGITIGVANRVTIAAGTLLISPSATSVAITALDDKQLVWRTSPSDLIQADAHAALFPAVETKIKSLIGSTKVRVAIAHKADSYGKGLASALSAKLRINGAPALNQDAEFKVYDYGDPDDPQANPTKYPDTITKILTEPRPHAIFLFGITETVTELMSKIETGWTGSSPRPFYLLADGSLLPEVTEFAATIPNVTDRNNLRKRILGTIPGSNSPSFKAFRILYASKITDGTSADVGGTANAYDAVYNIAFAAVAIGDKPLTGANLKDGFAKLVGGSPVSAGQASINAAFQTLSAGNAIDYNGASGPLDYDLTTGEAASDIQIWCVPSDPAGVPQSPRQSSVFYNAVTKTLQGSLDADAPKPENCNF